MAALGRTVPDMTASVSRPPAEFGRAVAGLATVRLRRGVEVGPLAAPTRLAPWAHAVSVAVHRPGNPDELASGRLILLYDPDRSAAWHGTLRVVVFATCEIEFEIADDPLLPAVAWSWLTDSLDASGARHTALGGTVTATSSTRFGDIAGPPRTDDVELRASWTAIGVDTSGHLSAFAEFLAVAAGLPPDGVSVIGDYATHSSAIADYNP